MKIHKEQFASNLRTLRAERRLTQRALGERIGFSEKTVSKWECGAAIPDVETLFSIGEVLGVPIEALFADGKHYYLGIDGGGTKTELALADATGRILRTHRTGACNPVDIGLERAKEILRDAVGEVCRGIPASSISAFAGIAGGSTSGVREELASFFSSFGFAHVLNESDNRNIIAAGLGERDGMTVILGLDLRWQIAKRIGHPIPGILWRVVVLCSLAMVLLAAYFISPLGIPMAAAWLLARVQDLRYAIMDAMA